MSKIPQVTSSSQFSSDHDEKSFTSGKLDRFLHRFQVPTRLILFLTIITVISLSIAMGYFVFSRRSTRLLPSMNPHTTPTQPSSTNDRSKALSIDFPRRQQVLVPYVPHFNDLKSTDLPIVNDIRGVFNYKNNIIVVSSSGIVEYDAKLDAIVRQNDYRTFRCVNFATAIGDLLYVACNGWTNQDGSGKGIYVINLHTGELVKIYREGILSFRNVTVTSLETTLWIGGYNGVAKIDTSNDEIQEYSQDQLGFKNCNSFEVTSNGSLLWVTPSHDDYCSHGVALYDQASDTWKTFLLTDSRADSSSNPILTTFAYNKDTLYFLDQGNHVLYVFHSDTKSWDPPSSNDLFIPKTKEEAINARRQLADNVLFRYRGFSLTNYFSYFDTNLQKAVDFEIFLPEYVGLSNQVNGKYYLFTSEGIYTLSKDSFPRLEKKLVESSSSFLGTKTFVDSSETYAVLIGPIYAMDVPYPFFTAHLIDLKTGGVLDLLQNNISLSEASHKTLEEFSGNIEQNVFFPTDNGVDLLDSNSSQTILHIDFQEKSLTFKDT